LLEVVFTVLVPPELSNHMWRSLRREDAAALHQLEVDCERLDGGTSTASIADQKAKLERAGHHLVTDTLCAVDATGRLAAVAWVTCENRLAHEWRPSLDGRVHPKYRGRGLGSFILQWMETRARQLLRTLRKDRPAVLRIDFYDRGDDALALFEEHGFRFAFAEDEMRRDLSLSMPAVHLPDGMSSVTWSPQRASQFFDVYQDAFRERGGFPHWSEEIWRHNFTGGAGFRPDLSLLLLQGAEAVGFSICNVETEGTQDPASVGWIVQMGVRPAWRRRGLASALLHEVMGRFQAEGLRWAALEVNIDNEAALLLYQQLGFERQRRRTVYKKTAIDRSR
jgi:mycothiol synthase